MTELDSARMAPKPTRAPVAERIRLLAGRDNLSQAAVAEKLGKPQTSVSSWFRGVYDPGPDDIVALARLFGCTADYLLGMVDAPTVSVAQDARNYLESIADRAKITPAASCPR